MLKQSPRFVQLILSLLLCLFSSTLFAAGEEFVFKKIDSSVLTSLQEKSYSADSLAANLRQSLSLSERHQLRLKKEGVAEGGGRYFVYQQYFDCVAVYGQELTVSLDASGKVIALVGEVAAGLDRLDKVADEKSHALSADAALNKAKKLLGAAADHNKNDALVANTTSTERVLYFTQDKQFHTAYLVNYLIDKGDDQAIHPYFIIDVETGAVLEQWKKARLSRIDTTSFRSKLSPVGEQVADTTDGVTPISTESVKPVPAMPKLRLKNNLNGQAAVSALGKDLPAVASFYGKTAEELKDLFLKDSTVHLDSQGMIYYVDPVRYSEPDSIEGLNPAAKKSANEYKHEHADDHAEISDESSEPIVMADVQIPLPAVANAFLAHSKPGASRVIYLDFNGHTVTGKGWNSLRGVGSFVQAPFDLDGSAGSFNDAERQFILETWRIVSNDFASFDVDVTTEEPSNLSTIGAYHVISPSNMAAICGSCGGVAYLNSFSTLNGYNQPSFTFNTAYSTPKQIANTISHEVGHQFGLNHDGHTKGDEYYEGHGLWNSIMGAGEQPIQHWSKGEYSGANNKQDDLAVIAAKTPYRVDDVPGTMVEALSLGRAELTTRLVKTGIIERNQDVDYYTFKAPRGSVLTAIVTPSSTTLHAKATLMNAEGVDVTTTESVDGTNGTGELVLGDYVTSSVETYYLAVTAKGNGNVTGTGYSSYGSLGHYTLNISAAAVQSIHAVTPERATVGQTEIFHAYVNSNKPLTFTSRTTGVCTTSTSGSDYVNLNYVNTGTCTIRVRQAGDINLAAVEKDFSFAVKREQTISPSSIANRLVSAGSFTQTISTTSGLVMSLSTWNSSINAGACSVGWGSNSTTLSITVLGQGTCKFRLYQAGNSNYWPAENRDISFQIRNYNQSITFGANPGPRNFGSGTFNVTATTTSTSPVVFSSLKPEICSVSNRTVTMLAVGTCEIAANAAMDANYLPAPQVSQKITINKGTPTVNFSAVSQKTYGDAPFTVTATSSSGAAISYSSTTPAVCTVSGSTVTIVSAGNCIVRASAAANANWNAGTGERTITINKAEQTITLGANPENKAFGDAPFALFATVPSSSSVIFNSTTPAVCSISSNNVLSLLAAGTCILTATAAADTNYNAAAQRSFSITVNKAQQTIIFGANPEPKTFGDNSFIVSATTPASSEIVFTSTTPQVCVISGNTVSIVQAGNCVVAANAAADANYTAATQTTQTIVINKATQIISFGQNPESKVWGSGDFTVSAATTSSSPIVFSSLSPSICTVFGNTVQIIGVGQCSIAANAVADTNYLAAEHVVQTIQIVKAEQEITFPLVGTVTYGAAPVALNASTNASSALTFSSLTPLICAVDNGLLTSVTAGECRVLASAAEDGFYNAASVAQSIVIEKANQSIVLGQNPSQLRYGDLPFVLQGSVPSSSHVVFSSLTPAVCSVSNNVLTVLSAGSCLLQANAEADNNYVAAVPAALTISISKTDQLISFSSQPIRTYGDANFIISAIADSSSVVEFSSATLAVCSVAGNEVEILAAGECLVIANAAEDENYFAAQATEQRIVINKAVQQINFVISESSLPWITEPVMLSASTNATSTVVFGSQTPAVCSVNGNLLSMLQIGHCVITANSAADANFLAATATTQTISIVKANQVITFDPFSAIALGVAQFQVTASGGFSENPIVFSSLTPAICTVSASGMVNAIGTGTCQLQADQAGNDFYLAAAPVIRDVEILLDSDMDGIADIHDNCVLVANPRQLDFNSNGIGDACNDFMPMPEAVTGELKADKTGSTVAFAGDFDGDGYGDFAVATPGYDIPKSASNKKLIKDVGRVVVISGRTGEQLTSAIGVKAKDMLGFALAGNADIDGDGFMDVVVGSPRADTDGFIDTGSVTVLFGGADDRRQQIKGEIAKALFGSSLALADVNADGYADVIVGSPKDDIAGLKDNGAVIVFSGLNPNVRLTEFYGTVAKAYAGTSVAAGDIDGIVGAEIVIGAANDDVFFGSTKRIDAGSVKVYRMADHVDQPYASYYGNVAKAYLGKSLAVADVNADGFDDVIVGAPGDDYGKLKDVGSVSVFFGNDAAEPRVEYGAVAKAGLGNSVAAADVNGDGFADVIAGSSKDDKQGKPVLRDVGSVSIWSGTNAQLLGEKLYGDKAKDFVGTSVTAGDINGDGRADVIIGLPGVDDPLNKKTKDRGMVRIVDGTVY